MLADVIKDRENEKLKRIQEEKEKYFKPFIEDTIVYYNNLHIIGGIETWLYNLSKEYDFTLVYVTADEKQLDRLKKRNIKCIKYIGQPIECNTLIQCIYGESTPIKYKKRKLFIHCLTKSNKGADTTQKYDDIYSVSKAAQKYFKNATGLDSKVMYNFVDIEEDNIKPLIFGVFSRLSEEKGKERIIYLLDEMKSYNKPFLMLVFTDLPFEYSDDRVIFLNPTLDRISWMKKCDVIVQLSSEEAGCLTLQESLKLGKPVVVTRLDILEELNINKDIAVILDYDMSNLNIEEIWNLPSKVKWQEPISDGWEDIMKKKVYKEKYKKNNVSVVEVKETKTEKKKKSDKK